MYSLARKLLTGSVQNISRITPTKPAEKAACKLFHLGRFFLCRLFNQYPQQKDSYSLDKAFKRGSRDTLLQDSKGCSRRGTPHRLVADLTYRSLNTTMTELFQFCHRQGRGLHTYAYKYNEIRLMTNLTNNQQTK